MNNDAKDGELVVEETTKEMSTHSQHVDTQNLNPLVSAVLNGQDIDPDKLEKLLAVQEKYEANQAKKAYTQAMSTFRLEAPSIKKNAYVEYGTTSYSHSTLGYSLVAINPILGKHGLNPSWHHQQLDNGVIKVTCRLTHAMGHYEETSLQAMPDGSGGKNAIQAIGSTTSYLERYTLFGICGLASCDQDDDGAASGEKPVDKKPTENKLPPYPDDQFQNSIKSWGSLVAQGKKPSVIISTVKTKYTLTEEQITKINELATKENSDTTGGQNEDN